MYPHERIVCLTKAATATLYLLGEPHRIVGISGYTVRPPQARHEKPRVSAFISVGRDLLLVRRQEVCRENLDAMVEAIARPDAVEVETEMRA